MNENTLDEIDEFEAQGQLDALLDQVELGAEFTFTRRGKAIARMIAARPAVSETFAVADKQNPSGADGHMQHEEFRMGETFWCGDQQWRCTDIGTRVITAIKLDHEEDPSWYNGPPYAVAEVVFDEYDIEGCTLEQGSHNTALPSPAPDSEQGVDAWDSPESNAKRMAHAKALRDQARAGGLRFDAYLPPRLADWLLAHIEHGTFRDPSEAVFVMLGEQQELEPHADLRHEFLKRRLQTAIDNTSPSIPAEEVFKELRELAKKPRPEPAVWWRKR